MKVGRNDPCPCGSGKKYKRIPLPRAELARSEFFKYLTSRALETIRPRRRGLRNRAARGVEIHPLCPTAPTLEAHLSSVRTFFSAHTPKVAAALELLPTWLRFLQSRQILSSAEAQRGWDHLRLLVERFARVVEKDRWSVVYLPGLRSACQQSLRRGAESEAAAISAGR